MLNLIRRGHGSFQARQPVLVGWLIDLFLRPVPLWQRILMALGGVLVATIVRIPLEPMLHDVPYILFFPVILIVGLLGGPDAGFFAVLFASLITASRRMDQLASVQGLAMLATFWVICGLIITSASLVRALVRALADSEERLNILAHEMTHRVRNVIGLVQAISRQTLRSAPGLAEYHELFEARLIALGKAQDLVVADLSVPTELNLLLDRVIEPFGASRFHLSGDRTYVPSEIGSTLALLFHELGTNSLKYGSLSVPEGVIAVRWSKQVEDVTLEWREQNGPTVAAPVKTGFGLRLLKTAFPPGHGAASILFNPDGVLCEVRFSGSRFSAAGQTGRL